MSARFSIEIHLSAGRVVGGLGCVGKSRLFCIFGVGLWVGKNSKELAVRWEKNKKQRVGNECRLTRCPFVVSFLCLWSPVKMVYSFLVCLTVIFCCVVVLIRLQLTFLRLAEGADLEDETVRQTRT